MHVECWAKNSAMRDTRSMRYAPCWVQVIRYSVREVLRAADCTLRFTRGCPQCPHLLDPHLQHHSLFQVPDKV